MDFDRYGLPYKGSKSKLAAKIFEIFPTAENFYDLFAGGCAMTHFAIAHKNYKRIVANDINAGPVQLFRDAIEGKFENERRWISRDDFYRLKDSEPYVRYVWSFGNNGENYLYSKEVEPWKKALHFARVFGNFDLFNEFGIRTDGTRKDICENKEQYKKLYVEWYLKKIEKTKLDTEELRKNLEEKPEKKFCCVKKITHRATLCSGAALKVCEKVFMPRHQAEKFSVPGELFGWEEVCGF